MHLLYQFSMLVTMRVYVINMENRTDRWEEVLGQEAKIGFSFTRIVVESRANVNLSIEKFSTLSVVSTWNSHMKAMKCFLATEDSHAIIFEDDFVLKSSLKDLCAKINFDNDVDFIQLGFLHTSPTQFLSIKLVNFFNVILRLTGYLANFCPTIFQGLTRKKLVRDNFNIPFNLIPNDIRAGAHAYIISRRFASSVQQFNSPTFLSADGAFMAIGWMRSFRMYRLRRNLIKQSNSISSVTDRTIN